MAELILYKGSAPIMITPREPETYLYRIGPGQVRGGSFIDLNDAELLNQVAEQIRDDYSEWVYKLNDLFTESNLIVQSCSLFFCRTFRVKGRNFLKHITLFAISSFCDRNCRRWKSPLYASLDLTGLS